MKRLLTLILWGWVALLAAQPSKTNGVAVAGAQTTDSLPRLKWKFAAKGTVFESPVVSEGVVYAGDTSGRLYALDEETGALKWTFMTKGWIDWIKSSPVVSGGVVYVANVAGYLYAVDARTGRKIWRFRTGIIRQGIYSTPAVFENLVLVLDCVNGLFALDAHTGKPVWRFKVKGGWGALVINEGAVLFGGEDEKDDVLHFYAVDARTGALKWKFEIKNTGGWKYISDAVVSDGMVFFSASDDNMYALDAQTGALKWKSNKSGNPPPSPAVWEDLLVFTAYPGHMFALDKYTGALRWSNPHPNGCGGKYHRPLIVDGLIFTGGCFRRGNPWSPSKNISEINWSLNIFDVKTGEFKGDFNPSGMVQSRPIASKGVVFFGSFNDNLYAVQYK